MKTPPNQMGLNMIKPSLFSLKNEASE